MFGDNVVPDRQGAIDVAGNPGIQRFDMSPFPRSRLCRHGVSGSRRFGGERNVGQLVRQHREVASCAMRETKLGIGGDGTGEVLRDISTVFQIREDRSVEAGGCFAGRRGDRQPMLILKQVCSPSDRIPPLLSR